MRSKTVLETWKCKSCDKAVPEVTPYFQLKDGVKYLRPYCKQCDNKGRRKYKCQPKSPEAKERDKIRGKAMRENKTPEIRAALIIKNSMKADKARGRTTDLSIDLVVSLITQPCCYCGCSELTTLDRIDNLIGHVPSNIVPACMRCNVTRGGMPYEAWLVVSRGMREAREAGLFGDWTGRTTKRISPSPPTTFPPEELNGL